MKARESGPLSFVPTEEPLCRAYSRDVPRGPFSSDVRRSKRSSSRRQTSTATPYYQKELQGILFLYQQHFFYDRDSNLFISSSYWSSAIANLLYSKRRD